MLDQKEFDFEVETQFSGCEYMSVPADEVEDLENIKINKN